MFSFQPLWRARFNNAFGMSPTYIARAPWFVNDVFYMPVPILNISG